MPDSAQSRKLELLNRTPPGRLHLLSGPRPKGTSHPYPRHYNPRHVPYPFEGIRPPPTPLMQTIDLPDFDDLPPVPIFATPHPTAPASSFGGILTFDDLDDPFSSRSRSHRPAYRVRHGARPLPLPPAERSEESAETPSSSILFDVHWSDDMLPPRADLAEAPAADDGVGATAGTSPIASAALPPPVVDAMVAVPRLTPGEPHFKWDVMLDPFKAIQKPENAQMLRLEDLRRWAAICKGPRGVRKPLTHVVLILKDIPGFEISIERSVIPPLLPPSTWPTHPHAVIIYDVVLQLYRELREPLTRQELAALSAEELARLHDAADARVGHEFGCVADILEHERVKSRRRASAAAYRDGDGVGYAHADPAHDLSVPLRRIDRLGRRRRFLGIRPAHPWEVPAGRAYGEVFVVELGMC